MKKFVFALVCALMLVFSSAPAMSADQGFYIEPKVGISAMQGGYLDNHQKGKTGGFDSNVGIAGGLAVGWDFYTRTEVPIRVEAEYMIRSNGNFRHSGKTVQAKAPQTVFANAYWDFHNSTDITPYVGGGLGASFVGPNTNFAWNVGGGLMYDITENVKANLGYRYVSFSKFENNHSDGLLNAHEVNFGLRYTF